MKARAFALLAICALFVAACARTPAAPRLPRPSAEERASEGAAASAPMAAATVAPTASAARRTSGEPTVTTPEVAAAFNIGVPAGNAYSPDSLALDVTGNLAYVYHTTSDKDRAVIAVVDLAAGQVMRLLPVGDRPLGPGRLLLTLDRQRLFLQEGSNRTLWTVDAQTGAAKQLLDSVRDIALSEDGKLLFAARDAGLGAYAVADLLVAKTAPQWQSETAYSYLAADGARLLAASVTDSAALTVFDMRTGTSVADAALPDGAVALSAGSAGGWAALVNGDKPRLIRFDAALRRLGETEIPYAQDFAYDASSHRFVLGGSSYEGVGSNARGYGIALAIDAGDGTITQETRWPTNSWPTAFFPWNDERLLAFQAGGPALLSVLQSSDLTVRSLIPMGARVDDAVIAGDNMLYVADDIGRIHALRLPGGEEVALWVGGAPLALDTTNGRLYANRAGRVIALDLRNGNTLAQFPQGGYPAPDPQRNLVYIADRGVTMYDRTGKRLNELASTFPDPQGFSPNPYAYAARVNPVTGHVAVILNNGIPGSNGGSFLRIYEPRSDTYATPPAPHSFIMDVRTAGNGNWYVAYSPARNQEAVQVLNPAGQELRRLDHRTGFLALDEPNDDLYLFTEGRITRLAASTLTALEALQGPASIGGFAFSAGTLTAYFFNRNGSRIDVAQLADFAPLSLKPTTGAPREDANNYGLAITAKGQRRALIGEFDEIFRTADGKTWQRLLPGLELQYADITAVDGGAVFLTGRSLYSGEGVWRSKDGGDTWEWLTGGLSDLAPMAPVLARSADEAYFYNRGQGLLRWDAAARRWQLAAARAESGDWTSLALAPDGALFRVSESYLESSADRGATWTRLGPTGKTGEVIGFSSLYTVTQTIFASLRVDFRVTAIQRSTDGGKTWMPSLTAAQTDLDGPLQMVTGFGRTYLLAQPYRGKPALLRTADYGDTWQAAPDIIAAGVTGIAVDPLDGRLWLAEAGGVRAVDPDTLRWANPGERRAAAAATPTRTPTRTPAPTATAGPCATPLAGGEAEIDARSLGLGCPRGVSEKAQMARQRFEGGQMIWRGDRSWIYVLYNNGTWAGYSDRWREGDPADDPELTAPQGFQQPVRGFGKVWREDLGGPASALGWALEPEQGIEAYAQDWDYGIVLRFGGEVIVLQSVGTWWR